MSARIRAGAARGFTLVELLIAIAIGMALTVVVSQLFYHSRTTYTTTEDVSRMQENIRFAYQVLTRTVHLAGYKSAPNVASEVAFPPGAPAITGVEGAAAGASDTLTVSYQGSGLTFGAADGTIVDCTGTPVAAGVVAVNTFTVGVGANGANALFCNGVETVADVENMQVIYGEDTSGDLVANNFVNASQVTDMANVRSVRIALLFSTRSPNSALAIDSTTTYDLHGQVLGPFNDRLIRRPVVLTVSLRNRTP